MVGYANDKRNSSRLQIIEPIDDITNLCSISKVTTLETLEDRGKISSDKCTEHYQESRQKNLLWTTDVCIYVIRNMKRVFEMS